MVGGGGSVIGMWDLCLRMVTNLLITGRSRVCVGGGGD